eukprot:Platyproteum_vivax@DN3865_c0_g1_i1.p1
MVVCVECGTPISNVYREFSKGNIRLTCCDRCGLVADKYVELDTLTIFIDLILHRSQAYRHVLFNRLPYFDVGIDVEILKFALAIVFFDTYTRWFLLKKYYKGLSSADGSVVWQTMGFSCPPWDQHLRIFLSAAIGFVVYLWVVRMLVQVVVHWCHPKPTTVVLVKYNYLVAAVILSCFGKLGTLLMMIWDYEMNLRHTISFFTSTSNIVAVKVFLNYESALIPTFIILIARLAKWGVQSLLLSMDPLEMLYTL